MAKRTKIKELLATGEPGTTVVVKGWVRTFRNNQFIALNDGSTLNNLQVVVKEGTADEALLKQLGTSTAIAAEGQVVESPGKGQRIELVADKVEIIGTSQADSYPIQPKKHSLEFLRENGHLRMRTNTYSSIFRIRHALSFAVHQFFNNKGFFYIQTPIITASDAEGAGEMFRVTTLSPTDPPLTESGEPDYSQDFFGQPTNLTVSGQLQGEISALALGEIYTFGPTFRAENSNTTRHLAEFWMIEPEMAFYDIDENADLAQEMVQYLLRYVMLHCEDDLAFLDKRFADEEKAKPQQQRSEMDLLERLRFVLDNPFVKIDYTEAVDILLNSKPHKKKKFTYPVEWGIDLQSEHERYLVEKHFKCPVTVVNYPKDIKAFYMKLNDDGKTVRAMDILFPGIGEMVGGSQREDSLEKLQQRMAEMDVPAEELWWYLDLRKFGSVPHSGFGLGFERLMMFVTGMSNIRDVIPFPRFPQSVAF